MKRKMKAKSKKRQYKRQQKHMMETVKSAKRQKIDGDAIQPTTSAELPRESNEQIICISEVVPNSSSSDSVCRESTKEYFLLNNVKIESINYHENQDYSIHVHGETTVADVSMLEVNQTSNPEDMPYTVEKQIELDLFAEGKILDDGQARVSSGSKGKPSQTPKKPKVGPAKASSKSKGKSSRPPQTPKAGPVLRSATAKQTRGPRLTKGKLLIARVYRFLKTEYEQLKEFTGNSVDLSPLANILKRTADATGVSEDTVSAILEEQRSKKSKKGNATKKHDKCQEINTDVEQQAQEEYEMVSLKVKVEESDELQEHCDAAEVKMKMDPLLPCETCTAVHNLLISTTDAGVETVHVHDVTERCSAHHVTCDTSHETVKLEPDDDDIHECSSRDDHVTCDTSHPAVKSEPDDDVTHHMECTNNTVSDPLHTPDISEPPEQGPVEPASAYVYGTSNLPGS